MIQFTLAYFNYTKKTPALCNKIHIKIVRVALMEALAMYADILAAKQSG